jgi:hypothetical protein
MKKHHMKLADEFRKSINQDRDPVEMTKHEALDFLHEIVTRRWAQMPDGTRELFGLLRERAEYELARLHRRIAYGGKKSRSARRKLRQTAIRANVWAEPEKIIAMLYGPEWARPPFGFAK